MATPTLPADVIIDILLRLPVKSLARFKCVQNSWRALIESPGFVAKHLCRAISRRDNPSLLVKREQPETGRNLVTLHSRDVPGNFMDVNLPVFNENIPYLEVLPVCANGVVCLYDHGQGIVLWNPALREFKAVPVHTVSVPPKLDAHTSGVGFGYDVKTDDFKVVRITDFWNDEGEAPPLLVEVYSLKTNTWRKVESDMSDYIRYSKCSEVFVNGAYHWWAIDCDCDEEDRQVILAFDIGNEVFRKLELPDLGPPEHGNWKSFSVLNDSIALILYPLEGLEKSFDIWVMNEYGLKDSWTKECKIGPIAGVDRPLGFWNNEKLLLATLSGDIIMCDLVKQNIETIQIGGVSDSLRVINYTESLVSVKEDNS